MIHVIGNAAVDSVIRVERLPRPGETVVALGASEDLGGKGANQAIVAALRRACSPRRPNWR
jgi:ribokinase